MGKEIKSFLKKENKDILISFIVGFIICLVYIVLNVSYTYSMNVKTDLKENIIRFHVLANSNETYDQELKLFVKDSILEKYKDELLSNPSREEAIKFFEENSDEIEKYATTLVRYKGYAYDVKCELDYATFPRKSYRDITLPSGEYLSFRVLIGDSAGENFWCVLYPPLCYVEAVDEQNFNDARLKLEDNLTNDEFYLISETENPLISVKFKIVEMW